MEWGDCVRNGIATLKCVPVAFGNMINGLFAFAGITAVFFIILSGIKFVTSSGDPEKVESARKSMTYSVIGLVVVLLSFLIIKAVAFVTGTECITVISFTNCNS